MEIFNIKNLTFKYPNTDRYAVNDVSLTFKSGDFIVLTGKSGCGKTTLLRMLKKELTPHGEATGEIFYKGIKIQNVTNRTSAGEIGFIMQDPDSQLVTDTVYSELAFGLENLGCNSDDIRIKVSEFATYFGIGDLINKDVNSLSGGEKQLVNLASIMAMNPEVIIFDEPTAQLDPISTRELITNIKRLNDDFGTTIIIAEHRLQELFPIAHKIAVMENGKIIAYDTPRKLCAQNSQVQISKSLPAPVRVYKELNGNGDCPLTVREGRDFLQKNYNHIKSQIPIIQNSNREIALCCKDIWFRYKKNGSDILKSCSVTVNKGELYGLMGENGSGKSTLLKILSGVKKPYRGKIKLNGNKVAWLPQNPKNLFVKDTLEEELITENNSNIELISTLNLENLLKSHPYDLSGGELQRAGLAKILLTNPEIILLDEPTKGLDPVAKDDLGALLKSLTESGITIIMVTHDIEFTAEYATRCGLLFDGSITAENYTNPFFTNNSFYTTEAVRMSRNILNNAVTADDIIKLCRGDYDA